MGVCASACAPACCLWPCHNISARINLHDPSKGGTRGGKGFSISDSTYMLLPNSELDASGNVRYIESLQEDCDNLYKAMKGCGTNDDRVIRTLVQRTPAQIEIIKKLYFEKAGVSLEDAIKDETSGDFQAACLSCILQQSTFDAEALDRALSGIGTDEERLNEILTMRHPGEIKALIKSYSDRGIKAGKAPKDLWTDIGGDTSFKYEEFMKCMVDRSAYLAYCCWDAIAGTGTDDSFLIKIISSLNRDNSALRKILAIDDNFDTGWKDLLERQCLMPDLQQLQHSFQNDLALKWDVNKEKASLYDMVAADTSGNYGEALLHFLKPKGLSGAEDFQEALQGWGGMRADKEKLIIIAGSRSNYERMDVAAAYKKKYGTDIRDAIREKCGDSDEFSEVTRDMFEDNYERWADYMYLAMHGWTEGIDTSKKDNAGEALFRSGMIGGMGTDEARLIRTVMFATRHDLKLIIQAYDQKFKRNMVKDVQSETKQMPGLAGSFAKCLVYAMSRAVTNMVHVPRQKLVRITDMSPEFDDTPPTVVTEGSYRAVEGA